MIDTATILSAALPIVGAILIAHGLFRTYIFGCYSEHETRNTIIYVGVGVALVAAWIYLMGGVPTPETATNVTCHWENTSTSTALVCPRTP